MAALVMPISLYAGLPLETETARLPKAHTIELDATYEYQTSNEGKEMAAPLAVAYGITDKMELLVEPVFYTAIRPKVGRKATGAGDTETTFSYVIGEEGPRMPALCLAAGVKKPDCQKQPYLHGQDGLFRHLIDSKLFGKLDTHFSRTVTHNLIPPN